MSIISRHAGTRVLTPSRGVCTCTWRGEGPNAPNTHQRRNFFTTPGSRATTLPITGAGPPPSAPQPKSLSNAERVAGHRRKAALLEAAKEIRQQQDKPTTKSTSPLKRRFWQSVYVKETPEGYQIMLDKRPVRTPTKNVISIPLSKPTLAHAVAIEWDLLSSAQEALKNHKIPMTSIVSRAHDILEADTTVGPNNDVREAIQTTMLRYLDTDTLLCWAPERSSIESAYGPTTPAAEDDSPKRSLRDLQMETAKPIIAFLTGSIWPGVSIIPTLDPDSIIPIQQSEVTRSVIAGWIAGLPAYELAALERAVLATKSLLVGARLIVEWSEEFRHLQQSSESTTMETISTAAGGSQAAINSADQRFGVESAAQAASLEVSWQTAIYGEVEDTHDVEKEDVRRQLGSAVLMVSGHGSGSTSR
jgi:ATP synthase mitochondrial F1 complex assembly factor 2